MLLGLISLQPDGVTVNLSIYSDIENQRSAASGCKDLGTRNSELMRSVHEILVT